MEKLSQAGVFILLSLSEFYQPLNHFLTPFVILICGFFFLFSFCLVSRTVSVRPSLASDASFISAFSIIHAGLIFLVLVHLSFILLSNPESVSEAYDFQLIGSSHTFIFKFLIDISYLFFLLALPSQFLAFEFLALTFLSYAASLVLFESADLISFFVLLELQTIPGYVLLALKPNSLPSLLASMNYFILGASSTLLTLLGLGFLYGITGLTDFYSLSIFLTSLENFYPASPLHFPLKLAFFFLMTSFLFKFGLFPFHTWLVQVYSVGYLPALFFLSWVPKLSLATMFFFLWGVYFSSFFYQIQSFLLVFGLASTLGGGIFALLVPNLNLILAYLAVSSGGFLFLLFSASCDPVFSTISIAYAVYSISLAVPLVLFLLLADPHQTSYPNLALSALSQLRSASGIIAASLAGVFYAVAGLPPTVGFWIKLFAAYFLSISLGFPIAFFSLLVISLLNLFLFLRILSALFFYPPLSEPIPSLEFSGFQIFLLISFTLLPYFVPVVFVETLGILFFHLMVFAVH